MAKWNSLRVETWRDVMEWNSRIYGDKPAVVSPETGKRRSYAELNERTNRLCNALIAKGVAKGERVAILATDIPEYLEVSSSSKAGFVYVPLNWRLQPKELVYILNDSGAVALLVEERFLEAVRAIRNDIPGVKHFVCIDDAPDDMENYDKLLAAASPEDPGVDVVEEDLLGIVYTSGTTGLPKGVIKKHRDTLRFARMINWPGQLNSHSRCLGMWPLFHVALLHANFPFLMFGGTQFLLKRFDEEKVLKLINDEQITHLAGAPTMLVRITDHPDRPKYDTSSLHSIAYGGSPMPFDGLKRGIEAFGPVFHQGFGMTEGTGQTVLTGPDHLRAITEPGKEKILLSVGKPLPACELRLVDDDGNDVTGGEPGEIIMRSEAIIAGYWNNPEGTAELIQNGWLHTGDIGRKDEDGYVYLVDRKKDLIISGGENIASKDVENVIYTNPAVAECAVIGVPSEKWGEEVKAVISLRAGQTASEQEIIDLCAAKLGGFKKPRSVEIWDELPKNPVGKILKRQIREKYWAGRDRKIG
jgi:long-chain acyl-CoA synthetase